MFRFAVAAAAAATAEASRLAAFRGRPTLDDLAQLELKIPVPGENMRQALNHLGADWHAVTDFAKYGTVAACPSC